jgi:hypothetical protein
MADSVVPEWMETAADREAREERERMAEQRLIQAQREAHAEAIRVCSALVWLTCADIAVAGTGLRPP